MEVRTRQPEGGEDPFGLPLADLLRLGLLAVVGLFVLWEARRRRRPSDRCSPSCKEATDTIAATLRIPPAEARLAASRVRGRCSPAAALGREPGDTEAIDELTPARVAACAMVALPAVLRPLLLPPVVRFMVRQQTANAPEPRSYHQTRKGVYAAVLSLAIEVTKRRYSDLEEQDRKATVHRERNRLRQVLAPHVAEAVLSDEDALGEDLVAAFTLSDLGELAIHEQRDEFVRCLRRGAKEGADAKTSKTQLGELMKGGTKTVGSTPPRRSGGGVSTRELLDSVLGAKRNCGVIGLELFLVPRMDDFPLLEQMRLLAPGCPERLTSLEPACVACRLSDPCPGNFRALVPKPLWEWLCKWRDEVEHLHRRAPSILRPFLLPLSAEGGS